MTHSESFRYVPRGMQVSAWLLVVGVILSLVGTEVRAQPGAVFSKYNELKKKAAPVKAKFIGGAATPGKKSLQVNGAKFDVVTNIEPPVVIVDPVSGGAPICNGIKFWAELVDAPNTGRFANFTKHKWQRSERFYIWVETAVPVQISLYQLYPPGDPRPARQVTPREDRPETFATIPPGTPVRMPVMFQMDDNLEDEIMSINAIVSNSGLLPINTVTPANDGGDGGGGGAPVDAGGLDGPGGVIKAIKATSAKMSSMNAQAYKSKQFQGKSTKFDIAPCNPSGPPISQTPDDVAYVAIGAGNFGQAVLTLRKD